MKVKLDIYIDPDNVQLCKTQIVGVCVFFIGHMRILYLISLNPLFCKIACVGFLKQFAFVNCICLCVCHNDNIARIISSQKTYSLYVCLYGHQRLESGRVHQLYYEMKESEKDWVWDWQTRVSPMCQWEGGSSVNCKGRRFVLAVSVGTLRCDTVLGHHCARGHFPRGSLVQMFAVSWDTGHQRRQLGVFLSKK